MDGEERGMDGEERGMDGEERGMDGEERGMVCHMCPLFSISVHSCVVMSHDTIRLRL